MLKWFRKLRFVITNYHSDIQYLHKRINDLETLIRNRTNIAVDVGFKEASHVIVVGRYKGADYVQTFSIDTPDLASLIKQLKEMERYGTVRRIDAPPMFREVFKREFQEL